MISVGLIHLSCYCGADLFYVGNTVDGLPPIEIVERFEAKLGEGNFGFFSSACGEYGECPHCGLLFELPDPDVIDWLPFTDKLTFNTKVQELRQSAFSLKSGPPQRPYITSKRGTF
jgi:hypothetical protein